MQAEPLCDQPGTLVTRTRELLLQDERDLLTIHKETGVPFYWLRKFTQKNNTINNPSANRIQYLYEHLTGAPLL